MRHEKGRFRVHNELVPIVTGKSSPSGESKESLSESHQAEAMTSKSTDAKSRQALTTSSKGSSPRKLEANRRNAKKSTGPKTSAGKVISSWNSTRHGLLAKHIPPIWRKNRKHFNLLLSSLQRDLKPVGTLEEVLVEKVAQEYWRLGVAAEYEALAFTEGHPFVHSLTELSFDTILRYQTMANRQLFQAMNQLERLQRLRKGDDVPAPLNVEVLHDAPTISEDENPEE
jgi:hypothetical protein